ncbi:MAG: YihY/virulence factor BrkB family protein [Actinomycetota bacterium]|nr:YihY/virulence factor BrkB family protein [Actinomycetota bacterium]
MASRTRGGSDGAAGTAPEERPETGTVPSGPQRLRPREWLDVLKRTFKEFLADDCMGLAQQVAYSSLLAFFPALIFLVGLLGLVDAYDDMRQFLAPVAPGAVIDIIDQLQEDSAEKGASAAAFVIGLFGALWAASGAMNAIVKAVNRAYERMETRPFWKVRLISITLVVAAGLVTAGMFLMIVFGGPLGEAIADRARLGGAWDLVWGVLRWPLAFVVVLLLFALIFYLAPNQDQRDWKWISPGSLLGGLMWLALSGLFAVYTSFTDSYSKTYGSLAGGVVLLLWLNYTAWAVLFGAELNSELDKQADIRAAGGPQAGLVKPARRVR